MFREKFNWLGKFYGQVFLRNDKNEKQNMKIKSGFSDETQCYCLNEEYIQQLKQQIKDEARAQPERHWTRFQTQRVNNFRLTEINLNPH
jgi:hypothetical protein